MNRRVCARSRCFSPWALAVLAFACVSAHASDAGRLFYSPAQRAQLEAARSGTPRAGSAVSTSKSPAGPVQFDGVVVRSDGKTTTWINGEPRSDTGGAANLKPGQIRARGKVYEPYQVLAPGAKSVISEGAP
jgi:hypothetical protein